MKALIIQAGAKPEQIPTLGGYDVVVVCEQAAAALPAGGRPADWWVMNDPAPVETIELTPSPKLFLTRDALDILEHGPYAGRLPDDAQAVKLFEPLWTEYPSSLGWSLFTTSAAIVLASSLGATAVEVVGSPPDGGRPADVTCEAEVLTGLAKHLAASGVVVSGLPTPPAPAETGKRKGRKRA